MGLSDGFFLCLFPTAVWLPVEFDVVDILRGSYAVEHIGLQLCYSCTWFTYTVG